MIIKHMGRAQYVSLSPPVFLCKILLRSHGWSQSTRRLTMNTLRPNVSDVARIIIIWIKLLLRNQIKLYKRLSFTFVRARRIWASATSICSSNAVNCHLYHATWTCHSANVWSDNNKHQIDTIFSSFPQATKLLLNEMLLSDPGKL